MNVPVEALVAAERNPNKMDDERYRRLVESIQRNGFVQPILVRDISGATEGYEIVDGHHRARAAREVGLVEVPAEVTDVPAEEVELLRLSMGNRGRTDLAVAGAIFADTGLPPEELTYTGFSTSEIDDLIAAASPNDEDLETPTPEVPPAAPPPSYAPDDGEAEEEKPFELLVAFPVSRKKAYQLAKRRIKKAAGKSGDLWQGLLRLLGEDV